MHHLAFQILCLIILISSVRCSEIAKILLVNETCPRFVYLDIENQGLGDQMAKIFGLMAAAYSPAIKITAVVQDNFGLESIHLKGGYKYHLRELGIPDFINRSTVLSKWKPIIFTETKNFDDLMFTPEMWDRHPCNSFITLSNFLFCSSGRATMAFCTITLGSVIQNAIRPLLDEIADTRNVSNINLRDRVDFPLKRNKINVVWHMRTGDVCLKCDSASYFEKFFSFIQESLAAFNNKDNLVQFVQNIIVHQASSLIPPLFKNIPNTVMFTDNNVTNVLHTFLQADILVSTGSSFVNHVAWTTRLHHPIVLQGTMKEAVIPEAREAYGIIEGRAIRFGDDGSVLNKYVPEDLHRFLRVTGVLDRLSRNGAM